MPQELLEMTKFSISEDFTVLQTKDFGTFYPNDFYMLKVV